jgi:crotonobetaine/carnitine-CoA ligase
MTYQPIPEVTAAEAVAAPPLREQLLRRFDEQPELPALHTHAPEGWRTLTYGELGRAAYQTAHALTAVGAHPGARVGVMLPNGEAFVRAWLALALLNVTMVPVNVHLTGATLRHILLNSDLDLLLVDEPLLPVMTAACEPEAAKNVWALALTPRPPLPILGEGVTCSAMVDVDSPSPIIGRGGRARSEGDVRAGSSFSTADFPTTPPPPVPVAPSDLALIVYTSGTTGPSKGVMLSRAAQLWHGLNYLRDFIRLGPGETGYTPLPLFHVSAQGFSLGCLLGGAAVAVDSRFSAFSFWDTVRRHNAKAFNYVGAMLPMLYHRRPRPDDADNPVERAVGSATAPELHEAFERRFAVRLIETYGQTETAGLWLMQPETDRRIGTIGTPRRWLEAAVLRPDGTPCDPDEPGEIALRPAHPLLMTTGYFRDDAATAHTFHHSSYWTGDAGSRDAGGVLRFRGRLKEFIRRRGENISAFEVEREALTHPAVREAAAVGVPSDLGEEEIKLCVILHEGTALDPPDLDRHLRTRLAPFMRPRYIEIRPEFPRTPTQRVQKFKLRDEGIPPSAWDRKARRPAGER